MKERPTGAPQPSREANRTSSPRPALLFFIQLRGKLRRIYLTTFRAGYVRAQAARRAGECSMCGACCRLAYRCPFLTRENRCKIYESGRVGNCTRFPIDERDLREVPAGCGYRFKASARRTR